MSFDDLVLTLPRSSGRGRRIFESDESSNSRSSSLESSDDEQTVEAVRGSCSSPSLPSSQTSARSSHSSAESTRPRQGSGSQPSPLRRSARIRARSNSGGSVSPLGSEVDEPATVLTCRRNLSAIAEEAPTEKLTVWRRQKLEELLEKLKPPSFLAAAGEKEEGRGEGEELFQIDTMPADDAGEQGPSGSGTAKQKRSKQSRRSGSAVGIADTEQHYDLCSRIEDDLHVGELYIDPEFDPFHPSESSKPRRSDVLKNEEIDDVLKKSAIGADFEQKERVPEYKQSRRAAKRERKAEREKTTGGGWFDLKAPEMSDERKHDLEVMQMRDTIDPKRHYKSADRDERQLPKYFQIGTILDNAADFYHARVPKRERKRTLVDELLADLEFRRYNKRKYAEVVADDRRRRKGAFQKAGSAAAGRKPPAKKQKMTASM